MHAHWLLCAIVSDIYEVMIARELLDELLATQPRVEHGQCLDRLVVRYHVTRADDLEVLHGQLRDTHVDEDTHTERSG